MTDKNQNTKAAQFFDDMAASYTNRWDESDIRTLVARLGLEPGMDVYEPGCGPGDFTPFLWERIGPDGRLLLTDISRKMISRARRQIDSAGQVLNVQTILADAERFAPGLSAFDAVVCFNCFPHFGNKPLALERFRDCLKPAGRLAICHDRSRAEVMAIHQRHRVPKGISGFPEDAEMRRLVIEVGLRIESFQSDGPYLLMAIRP